MIYRNQVAQNGPMKGTFLDTKAKATVYVAYLYNRGLITRSEYENSKVHIASEFSEKPNVVRTALNNISKRRLDVTNLSVTTPEGKKVLLVGLSSSKDKMQKLAKQITKIPPPDISLNNHKKRPPAGSATKIIATRSSQHKCSELGLKIRVGV